MHFYAQCRNFISMSMFWFEINGDAPLITNSVVTDFIDRANGCDVAFAKH